MFVVTSTYDPEAKVWCAQNDDLGLIVEADDFDTLVKESWSVARDLAEMNIGQGVDIGLRFVHDTHESEIVLPPKSVS